MFSPYYVSLLVIIFLLCFFFSKYSRKAKLALFIFVTLESLTVLSVFTDPQPGVGKYPIMAILPVLIFSSLLSFSLLNNKQTENIGNSILSNVKIIHSEFLVLTGFILIISTILMELLIFDGNFSPNTFSLIFLGILLTIYERITHLSPKHKSGFLLFTICFCVIFPISTVIVQIVSGDIGTSSSDSYRDEIVYWSLGRPLANILTIAGFDVWAIGDTVFYTDLTQGKVSSVSISSGCSGLNSLLIFFCALISYLYMERPKLDSLTCFLFIFGTIISYLANLLRMGIIIIVGHYYGPSYLAWTHANIGWVIFTIWVFIFWTAMHRLILTTSYRNIYTH